MPENTSQNHNIPVDVLCVGHACYDLTFGVDHHIGKNEKMMASAFTGCGGGPAANAAFTASRLGIRTAFIGYLGKDFYGEQHFRELQQERVVVDFIARGEAPTPVSMVLVKPGGSRSVVNYRKKTPPLAAGYFSLDQCDPRVILFDGHEPGLSVRLAKEADARRIPTVLDAGSVHLGTEKLIREVDYLVVSEKFAYQYTSRRNAEQALRALQRITDTVIVTLGERGLIWGRGGKYGKMSALPVKVNDTNGAGDAFHGAFCAGLSQGMEWDDVLLYASSAAAGCCTRLGGRGGLPTQGEVLAMMKKYGSTK